MVGYITEAVVDKSWIPKISGEELSKLSERIRPVVHFNGHGLCHIKPVHHFVTFLRDPEIDVIADGLEDLCTITTFHTFGSQIYFNPTTAEMLAQIPPEHIDKVVAFEIITNPEKDGNLNQSEVSLKAGYHTVKTRLYVAKK